MCLILLLHVILYVQYWDLIYLELPQAAADVFRETLCGNNVNISLLQLSEQILLHLHKHTTSHKGNRNRFLGAEVWLDVGAKYYL